VDHYLSSIHGNPSRWSSCTVSSQHFRHAPPSCYVLSGCEYVGNYWPRAMRCVYPHPQRQPASQPLFSCPSVLSDEDKTDNNGRYFKGGGMELAGMREFVPPAFAVLIGGWWYKLARVCRRWRYFVLTSAPYLDLNLLCMCGTLISDMLAHSPPFPLVIDRLANGRNTI